MVLRLNIVIISSTLRAKEQLFWSEKIYHTVVKRSIPALRYSLCNSSQGNVQFSKQSGFQTCLKQMYGDKMNFSSSFTSKIQETFLLELLKCSFFAFFLIKCFLCAAVHPSVALKSYGYTLPNGGIRRAHSVYPKGTQ